MTLVELLLGTALLVGGSGALLLAMHQAARYGEYLSQRQLVMNVVQGRMEQLASTSMDVLLVSPARLQGSGVAEPIPELPNGSLHVKVRDADPMNPDLPSLLDLHIAACWRTSDGRLITGEDVNCNGLFDAGEDTDGDQWMDAPVELSTRISRQE